MKKITIILGLLLLFSLEVFASIGKIVALKGDVFINRDKTSIKATSGMELEEKDNIKTGKNAKTQIRFKDKTTITIGKNSDFSIDEYVNDDKKPSARFAMRSGVFRAITGKIGKIAPNRFKIKTKTASIGIRGTQFVVKATPTNTVAACTQSTIVVTSLSTGTSVEVKAGFVTQVSQDKAPSAPKVFTSAELKQISGELEEESEDKKESKKEDKKDNTKKEEDSKKKDDSASSNKKEESKDNKSQKSEDKKNENSNSSKQQESDNKKESNSQKNENSNNGNSNNSGNSDSKQENGVNNNESNNKSSNNSNQNSNNQGSNNNQVDNTQSTNSAGASSNNQNFSNDSGNDFSNEEPNIDKPEPEPPVSEPVVPTVEQPEPNKSPTFSTQGLSKTVITRKESIDLTNIKNLIQDPDGDSLTITFSSSKGSFEGDTYNPSADFVGKDTITVRAVDSKGNAVEKSFELEIENQLPTKNNLALTINAFTNKDNIAIPTSEITKLFDDADGDTLVINGAGVLSNSGTVSFKDGNLNFVPNSDFKGSDKIRVFIIDNFGAIIQYDIDITVIDSAPSFSTIANGEITNKPSNAVNRKKVSSGNEALDAVVEYGYWLNDTGAKIDTYIAGNLTPEDKMDEVFSNAKAAFEANQPQEYYKSTYSGGVIGLVGNNEITNGSVNINIDFSQNKFDGNMNFEAAGNKWSANINNGYADSVGFDSSDITKAEGSVAEITDGVIKGQYFGDNAEAVGGGFNINSSNLGTARGSFTGVKK